MRPNALFASDDPEVVRALVRENPWATLISEGEGGLIASHYPVLLDDEAAGLAIVTHVGRPDEELHAFGDREMLVIVQGRHGYISPSWYPPGQAIPAPTWNFSAAHCYGVPQILDEEENLRVLAKLVDHFEQHVHHPTTLEREWAVPLAKRTVGIRVPITRFVCKVKLSQNKDPETQRRVIEELRAAGPYSHPELADEMERVLGSQQGS
jgi:transcriptional regulator